MKTPEQREEAQSAMRERVQRRKETEKDGRERVQAKASPSRPIKTQREEGAIKPQKNVRGKVLIEQRLNYAASYMNLRDPQERKEAMQKLSDDLQQRGILFSLARLVPAEPQPHLQAFGEPKPLAELAKDLIDAVQKTQETLINSDRMEYPTNDGTLIMHADGDQYRCKSWETLSSIAGIEENHPGAGMAISMLHVHADIAFIQQCADYYGIRKGRVGQHYNHTSLTTSFASR